ncbi:carbamoyltransferase C-terminal domain-containing protein [Maribacter flavus]|uniref:Transferase n=1 Tax=Maribacter flavus TaxID=1658664 RepID=A0A5B2TMU1_9FLAO|nr:carbamoyltransferase C-terminal domain-containing protein [Maribacter flavus]KAA2215787.1 hypothetical protein F0361_16460 [Maribacter flavus]
MPKKHKYVLGTNLSHDGSSCLIKDGKVVVAIEKERITRVKHDGGNDKLTMKYCLDAEGISLKDVDVIVQNANFGMFEYGNSYYKGDRLVTDDMNDKVFTISHHLAHCYSVIGTCPFDNFNILVSDGCGSQFDDCLDLNPYGSPTNFITCGLDHLFAEKDSYYSYENGSLTTLFKDFSEFGYEEKLYPMHPNSTKHSIGGIYSAVSRYCFGSTSDTGKLMGLSPYGKEGVFTDQIFRLEDNRVFVEYDWMHQFLNPVRSFKQFKENFQYYADIAYWTQKELERAILYLFESRLSMGFKSNIGYAGGVALNAVANAQILNKTEVKNLFMQPAAGDNGIALGCAYYGWLSVLDNKRELHDQSTCFGKVYSNKEISESIALFEKKKSDSTKLIEGFLYLLPLYFKKTLQIRAPYWIKLNFDDIKNYYIFVQSSGISIHSTFVQNPSATLSCKIKDFFDFLYSPGLFSSGIIFCKKLLDTPEISIDNHFMLQTLFSNVDIFGLIKAFKLISDQHSTAQNPPIFCNDADLIKQTAKLLSQGKIIGWFQDESEFGPRALGRRSILADPRTPNVDNYINSKIKFREDFRPFAPSIIEEEVNTYFENGFQSPYMILIDKIKDEWIPQLKSVIHIDLSSRVQTVRKSQHHKFYNLLKEFEKVTGLPLLLNTSFNCKGMPIVETPLDAIEFFFNCELDCLVLGNYLIQK